MHETGDRSVGERAEEVLVEGRVDEDERHPGGGRAAVRPGMVGAALYDDVARGEGDLGVVEDQGDLARQDDAVVHRRRAVHR